MEIVNVIVAGVAGFGFGALWYGVLRDPWLKASGVAVGADGKPANASDPKPYIFGMIAMMLVAGMMRHTFELSGIETAGKGLVSGIGIGAFMAAPWLLICPRTHAPLTPRFASHGTTRECLFGSAILTGTCRVTPTLRD